MNAEPDPAQGGRPHPRRCCVVIPTYNEAEHLPALLAGVFAQQVQIAPYELWVVVVDDDSPDGSGRILAELAAVYPRLLTLHGRKQGLGIAYQRGFAHALEHLRPELLLQMDADLQHDPRMLPTLVQRCRPGVAGVIGSRFAPGGSTPSLSRRRRLLSRLGNWLVYRISGLPHLYDYTSGYRCLNAALVRASLARCAAARLGARGYAFQSSLIAEMLLTGEPVVELPIVFGRRRHGRSKLGGRDYLEFALNLRRLRRRRRGSESGASPLPAA